MRSRGAIVWGGAAVVVLAMLVILVVIIRSNADASAPTASTAALPPTAPSTAPTPPRPPPLPRSIGSAAPIAPVGVGPLPTPPPGTHQPGPAPAPELHDLDDEELAARAMLQHDTSDFGKVVETLEDGTEVGHIRGKPVTDAEQERVRAEITKMAGAYETAYDRALAAGGTQPEFAREVHAARDQFDRNVRELYGLTEAQFFALFPHRRAVPHP